LFFIVEEYLDITCTNTLHDCRLGSSTSLVQIYDIRTLMLRPDVVEQLVFMF